MEKRPHLNLVEGGKVIISTYVDRFSDDFKEQGIKYYPAEQIDGDFRAKSDLLSSYEMPESFCRRGSPARKHWDDVAGQGQWALTPTLNREGEVVQGFVDVVSVPSDRPTVEEMIGSVSTHIVQGEGSPPLRPVQD